MKIFEINFMSTRDWWSYNWCDLISIDFILGTSKSASPRNENSNDKNIKFQSVRNCEKEIKSNLLMHVYVIQYQRFFYFGLIHVLLKVSRGKNESWINVYIYCILWSEGAFVGVTMVFFNNISSRIYWQKVDRKWSGWNLSMNEYRLLTQIHNDSQWRLFRKLQKTIITCSQTLTFRENGLLMKCRAVEYIINRIIE